MPTKGAKATAIKVKRAGSFRWSLIHLENVNGKISGSRSSLFALRFLPQYVDTRHEVTHDNTFDGFRVHRVRKYTLHHQTIKIHGDTFSSYENFSHYIYSIKVFSDLKSSTVPKAISRTRILAY